MRIALAINLNKQKILLREMTSDLTKEYKSLKKNKNKSLNSTSASNHVMEISDRINL